MKGLDHLIHQGFGDGAGGCTRPRWSPALASIAVQGELTDDEYGQSEFSGTQFAAVIICSDRPVMWLEDPQVE